ncbi:CPG2 protein, partial [Polypterus senegalus]|nr:CPG2 protein [Polypterus senegalus]
MEGKILLTGPRVCAAPTSSCQSKSNGNYAVPNNSSAYTACCNGNALIKPCPETLVFNEQANTCVYTCSRSVVTPVSSQNVCTGKVNGNYRNTADDSSYISCSNGIPNVMKCPANLVFNDNGYCDWPATSNFCKCKKNGNYENPSNVNTYFACSNGYTYVMPCPSNLVYNAYKDQCDWQGFIACYRELTFVQSCYAGLVYDAASNQCNWPVRQISSIYSFCSGRANGNYPNSADYYSYISCSNELTYIMPCPAGLIYNPAKDQCDWTGPFYIGCSYCSDKSNGHYGHPIREDSYFSCIDQYSYLMSCPYGITYDRTTRWCSPQGQSVSRQNICTGKVDGNYRNKADDSSYISCSNGIPNVMKCPANLVFNDKGYCDWPATGNFCKCKKNGNYANPSNVNTYFACSNGYTNVMPCPSNLVYNAYKDQCDWPGSGSFCIGKQDGNYANPSNSSTYIACSNQYTYVMPCYPGLVYNAAKDWCDWPSSPVTSAPSSCGCQISTSFCRTKASGNYAISSCSRSFIMCSNGLTYITPCPSNLIFNDIFKEQFAVTIETELKATAQIIHDKLSHSINEVVSGAQAEECVRERGKVFQISLTLLVDEAVRSIVDALRSRFAYFVDDHCSDYLLEMSKKDKEITKLKLQGRLFQDEMKTALQHIRQADSIFVQCLSRSTCDTRSNAAKEERDAGWLENRHSAMQFGGNQAMGMVTDEGEIFPSTKDELHTSNKQSEKMSKTVSIEDIHSGFFGITVTQNVKEHDALQIGDTDIYFPDPKQTEATAKESEHLKFCIKQEQLSACENNPLHINEEASEEAFVKVKEEDVEQDIDQTTEQNLNASNYSGATELENLELRHSFSQGNSLLSDNDNLEFQEREKSNEIVTTMPQENISVTSQHTASKFN